jgi:hypothetical protein
MTATANRCAIYFAPAVTSRLWQFGSSVIGYDAATGLAVPHPEAGVDLRLDWPPLTAAPRRYGFHATLKAPFHLASGVTAADVVALAREVAVRHTPVLLSGLEVATLGRFIALVPVGDVTPITRLAQAMVEAFEPVRAPLTEADRRRFTAKGLTPRQAANLERFGYPYVAQDFRFHMTLTDALAGPPDEVVAIAGRLREMYRDIEDGPVRVDQIAVFEQPDRASQFRIVGRALLAGGH